MLCPSWLPEQRVCVGLHFQRMRVITGVRRKQAAAGRHEQKMESSHLHFLSKAGVGVGVGEGGEGDSESGRGFNLKTLPQGCTFLQQCGTTWTSLASINWELSGQPNTRDYEAHCPYKAPERASSFSSQINLDELKAILMGFILLRKYIREEK